MDTKLERINIPKGNYQILRVGVMASCPKLGISLENRIISKFMVSKNVLLNSYFSIKKKMRKIFR